jgi:2-polyprenyl-3-methyl-5-hydroxy-6-metoxy-1,4-benzoquinol methylase/Zn ribbon nucleic-acid-binding protein
MLLSQIEPRNVPNARQRSRPHSTFFLVTDATRSIITQMDELLNRNCPSCKASETTPHWRKGQLSLVRCRKCSFVFASPVPEEFASGAFYDRAGGEYLSQDKLASDYAGVRFQRELRIFRAHCSRGSVLDVGCSSGAFLYQLKQRHPNDYQILGTDVSTAPLEHAAKMGVPVARGNFLDYNFTEQFDAVTFWAVMEHLFEPRLFLERAVALLKPGGLCFILVPNLDSLAVRLLGPKYRYIFPEHINYFTARTLKEFAARELSIVRVQSTHFNPIVIWQDFRRGERDVPRAERSSLLKRTNAAKQSPWLFPLRLAYRAAEAILAQFKLADNLVLIGRKFDQGANPKR